MKNWTKRTIYLFYSHVFSLNFVVAQPNPAHQSTTKPNSAKAEHATHENQPFMETGLNFEELLIC